MGARRLRYICLGSVICFALLSSCSDPARSCFWCTCPAGGGRARALRSSTLAVAVQARSTIESTGSVLELLRENCVGSFTQPHNGASGRASSDSSQTQALASGAGHAGLSEIPARASKRVG